MKLALTNHWFDKKSAIYWNKDGMLRMLKVLQDRDGWDIKFFKKHTRTFTWEHDYVDLEFSPNPTEKLLAWKPDAAIVFGDFTTDSLPELQGKLPLAQCYTGGLFEKYKDCADIIFVESQSYVDWMKGMGLNVRRAFGTNTDIFFPFPQPKIFDAVMTATFAQWKRQWLFAEALGKPAGYNSLVCGWWQEHEAHTWEVCRDNGVALLHHQLPESVNLLYNMSHTTVLTAGTDGGSQRSVLESMACGIPPIVMQDSEKCSEYVSEAGFGMIVPPNSPDIRKAVDKLKADPQDPNKGVSYINSKYTQNHYADAIKEGIESIC